MRSRDAVFKSINLIKGSVSHLAGKMRATRAPHSCPCHITGPVVTGVTTSYGSLCSAHMCYVSKVTLEQFRPDPINPLLTHSLIFISTELTLSINRYLDEVRVHRAPSTGSNPTRKRSGCGGHIIKSKNNHQKERSDSTRTVSLC